MNIFTSFEVVLECLKIQRKHKKNVLEKLFNFLCESINFYFVIIIFNMKYIFYDIIKDLSSFIKDDYNIIKYS